MSIKAKQIDAPQGAIKRAQNAFTILTGTSAYVTTASFAGQSSGGNDTTIGVFTAAPQNIANVYRRDNGNEITTAAGLRIFARTTFAATVFTTTLYVSDGAGGETAYTPVAGDNLNNVQVDLKYGASVALGSVKPTEVVNGLEFINETGGADVNSHVAQNDVFATPTAGQTSFTLTQTPKAGSVQMFINSVAMELTRDYTVSGATVTYLAADYAIATTDRVWFWYNR